MTLVFAREEIESARTIVRETVPPTPQYAWPLLRERLGFTVWVKHENHTPSAVFARVLAGST